MQSLHRCLVPLKWLFPTFFFAQKEKKGKRKLEPNNSNDDDDSKLESNTTYVLTYLGQWKSHKNDTLDFFPVLFTREKWILDQMGLVGFPILPSKSCWRRQWLRVWTCSYYRVIQLVQFTVSTPKPKSIV